MKSIYNIYEASLLDIDGTLEDGDIKVERQMIKKWVLDNKNFLNTGFCGEKFIKSDNALSLASFSPFDHYNNKYMELPVPEYIKISDVEDLLVYKNIDFSKLPKMDYVNMLYIDIWEGANTITDVKLSNINIKSLKNLYIKMENTAIDGFPKIPLENVFYNTATMPDWQYDGRYLIKDPKKFFKGLNCKYLAIPDVFFTTNSKKLYSYRPGGAWSSDRVIEFDSEEGKNIQSIFDAGGFKELYTYNARDINGGVGLQYRKISKKPEGFVISKRKKHFKM